MVSLFNEAFQEIIIRSFMKFLLAVFNFFFVFLIGCVTCLDYDEHYILTFPNGYGRQVNTLFGIFIFLIL